MFLRSKRSAFSLAFLELKYHLADSKSSEESFWSEWRKSDPQASLTLTTADGFSVVFTVCLGRLQKGRNKLLWDLQIFKQSCAFLYYFVLKPSHSPCALLPCLPCFAKLSFLCFPKVLPLKPTPSILSIIIDTHLFQQNSLLPNLWQNWAPLFS